MYTQEYLDLTPDERRELRRRFDVLAPTAAEIEAERVRREHERAQYAAYFAWENCPHRVQATCWHDCPFRDCKQPGSDREEHGYRTGRGPETDYDPREGGGC